MEGTESVSKGCFAFVPKEAKKGSKKCVLPNPLKAHTQEVWHKAFTKAWKKIEKQLEMLQDGVSDGLVEDLAEYIKNSDDKSPQIPTAAILTGVNLPDHGNLFSRLRNRLKEKNVANSIATLHSADSSSVKHIVERTVLQCISSDQPEENEFLDEDSDEEDKYVVKRTQCTLPHLLDWYGSNLLESTEVSPSKRKKKDETASSQVRPRIVIILQDFETFPAHIIHKYVQILSGYRDRLPLVLVLGIATTISALDDYLTHKCISRLSLRTFQSQPSVYFLNNTLNKVFLSPECPFQLSGKLFKFFTQVFLFYDLSVNRFIQGVKYCVLEHFREGKNLIGLLCTDITALEKNVASLHSSDLKQLRNLDSFQKHIKAVDSDKQRLLTSSSAATKEEVVHLMKSLYKGIFDFYLGLRLLYVLVAQLPQAPLGKQFRELYCNAMSENICKTDEYKECKQLVGFMAKEQILEKLDKMLECLEELKLNDALKEVRSTLLNFKEKFQNVGLNVVTRSPEKSPMKQPGLDNIKNRSQLKQKLFELGSGGRLKSGYELLREEFVNYLMADFLPTMLVPFTTKPLWEVVTIVESDSRNRVVPRIRGPIHTALNNPAHYLMCDCCTLKTGASIVPTMPDLCIVYKLHLESGSLINMYDWLQSFNVIVNPDGTDGEDIDPQIQARFSQAVADMEYLGFIKSSKKKTDHVARLTWGGSVS